MELLDKKNCEYFQMYWICIWEYTVQIKIQVDRECQIWAWPLSRSIYATPVTRRCFSGGRLLELNCFTKINWIAQRKRWKKNTISKHAAQILDCLSQKNQKFNWNDYCRIAEYMKNRNSNLQPPQEPIS